MVCTLYSGHYYKQSQTQTPLQRLGLRRCYKQPSLLHNAAPSPSCSLVSRALPFQFALTTQKDFVYYIVSVQNKNGEDLETIPVPVLCPCLSLFFVHVISVTWNNHLSTMVIKCWSRGDHYRQLCFTVATQTIYAHIYKLCIIVPRCWMLQTRATRQSWSHWVTSSITCVTWPTPLQRDGWTAECRNTLSGLHRYITSDRTKT